MGGSGKERVLDELDAYVGVELWLLPRHGHVRISMLLDQSIRSSRKTPWVRNVLRELVGVVLNLTQCYGDDS